jgi:hypothetical protein
MKQWRHYLLGSDEPVIVETDHRSLEYIQTQPHIAPMQVRWIEYLQQFNFAMRYREGKNNTVADALSRRADHRDAKESVGAASDSLEEKVNAIVSAPAVSFRDQIRQLKTSYLLDDYTSARLRQPDKFNDCVVKDGLLYDRADRLIILTTAPSKPVFSTNFTTTG